MSNSKIIKYYKIENELDLEKIVVDYSSYVGTVINNMIEANINTEDKEEIISDVFFIIWKNKNKLDENKLLSSYIAGVTRNVVREYFRKKKITLDISDYENTLFSFDTFPSLDENIEQINKIENFLNTVKNIDKKIFIDFYYSSKSIKDIAKELKISRFNVKTRLYRLRNKIRKEVL